MIEFRIAKLVALCLAALAGGVPHALAAGSHSSALFTWTSVGDSCKVLLGRDNRPIIFGSLASPRIFATGKCAPPIGGLEKYSPIILTGYDLGDMLFIGYTANGSRYLVYFGPSTGWRTQISDYVTRYIKNPNPPPPKPKPAPRRSLQAALPPAPDWQPPF